MPKPSLGILTFSNHNSSRSAAPSPIMMQTCTERVNWPDSGSARIRRLDKRAPFECPLNAGLEHLKELTGLRRLDLRFNAFMDVGADEVKKALPNWRICR